MSHQGPERLVTAQLWRNEILRQAVRDLVMKDKMPPLKPTLWQKVTYYAYRKWWYKYTDWLHRNCQ